MRKILFCSIILCIFIPYLFVDALEEEILVKDKDVVLEENDNNTTDGSVDVKEDDRLNLASNAKSAIMIETSTGKIIYEKNKDEKLPMASMTKMMTLLLIMENIENGNLKWDEMITTSEYAASMGGSQIFLEPGEEMSVEDLVKGICIGSGNDVAVIKKQSQVIREEIIISLLLKPYVLEYYYKLYIK